MKELQAAGYIPGTPAYQEALRLRTLGEGTIGFSDFQSKVNVDKAKKLLEFEMKISLKDGLKETIDWYRSKIK